MSGETDLATLLASMRPELHAGAFEFVSLIEPSASECADAVVIVAEAEGTTLVRPTDESSVDAMAWITLTVHSSLQAVGLTAAVAAALAANGIACNVVAGYHHDHLFVPYLRRHDAVAALRTMSDG